MAFNLLNLLHNQPQNTEIAMIDINDLMPHAKNRQIKDIDKLAEAIDTAGGIKQPLFVKKQDDGYKILAGHRRTAAAKLLLSQGKEQYKQVPCIIETDLDDDAQEILLIVLNEQQEKSDFEKVQDTIRLKELISRKKKEENIPGSVRQLTAEALGETPTQIARYESIDKKLLPELKDELKEGRIGISAAYEASRLEPDKQREVIKQPERSVKAIKKLSESDKSNKTLLPCPFCGGDAIINTIEPRKHVQTYEGGAFIKCSKCTCIISASNNLEAIKRWNRRIINGN